MGFPNRLLDQRAVGRVALGDEPEAPTLIEGERPHVVHGRGSSHDRRVRGLDFGRDVAGPGVATECVAELADRRAMMPAMNHAPVSSASAMASTSCASATLR